MRFQSWCRLVLLVCVFNLVLLSPLPSLAEGDTDPLWNRPSYEKKVLTVGQRLLQANGIPDKILFLVDHEDIRNASASRFIGPNTIRVYKDMLDVIDNDDELAAVLAHEIAHITKRHTGKIHAKQVATRTLVNTTLFTAGTTALVASGGLAYPLFLGGAKAWNHARRRGFDVAGPISRPYEKEADLVGLDYLVKAGYDPVAMETLYAKFAADSGPVAAFFSSHPGGSERLAYIHEAIQTRYAAPMPKIPDSASHDTPPANTEPLPSQTSPTLSDTRPTPTEAASTTRVPEDKTGTKDSQSHLPKPPASSRQATVPPSVKAATTTASTQTSKPQPTRLTVTAKPLSAKANASVPPASVAQLLLELPPDSLKALKLLHQRGYMTHAELLAQFEPQETETLETMVFNLQQKKLIRILGAEPEQAYVLSEWAAQSFENRP